MFIRENYYFLKHFTQKKTFTKCCGLSRLTLFSKICRKNLKLRDLYCNIPPELSIILNHLYLSLTKLKLHEYFMISFYQIYQYRILINEFVFILVIVLYIYTLMRTIIWCNILSVSFMRIKQKNLIVSLWHRFWIGFG